MGLMVKARKEVANTDTSRRYVANPFLHYTGAHHSQDINHLGFRGELPRYTRTEGVARVACLGGSTTVGGLPEEIEKYLNKGGGKPRFEVLNFGLSGWSSMHSLANLVFNVVDYSPDYIVIHHGWNDQESCQVSCARGDASHKYRVRRYRTLSPAESFLIKESYLYRSMVLDQLDEWIAPLSTMEEKDFGPCPEDLCKKGGSFYHYRRNLETMIHVARARNIMPMLASMPHSTQPPEMDRHQLKGFKQANNVMREVAFAFRDRVLFVDLDGLMTGKFNAHFTDIGHLDVTGKRAKASIIGKVILEHVEQAVNAPPPLGPLPPPPAAQ